MQVLDITGGLKVIGYGHDSWKCHSVSKAEPRKLGSWALGIFLGLLGVFFGWFFWGLFGGFLEGFLGGGLLGA